MKGFEWTLEACPWKVTGLPSNTVLCFSILGPMSKKAARKAWQGEAVFLSKYWAPGIRNDSLLGWALYLRLYIHISL